MNSRAFGLDLIRSLAITFVVASHFFLHTPFNQVPFGGVEMFLLGMGHTLFMTNVCLFMMLTGYLNINKQVSCKYYRSGIRVLVSYLMFSVLTIVFRKYYLHENHSLGQWVMKITDFSAIPYAWYIEMWIGLFLLTPFLNTLWRGIDSKRHRQVLIATLFVMCALPDFTNRYGLYLMPGYWTQAAYPLIYFFLGSYVCEYQPKVNRKVLGCVIMVLCLLNPLFSIVFMPGHTMMHVIGGPGGIVVIPLTVLVFLICHKVDFKSERTKRILQSVSSVSLEMYLVSFIFDALYYPLVRDYLFGGKTPFLLTFLVTVPFVLLSSYAVAWLTERIRKSIAHQ